MTTLRMVYSFVDPPCWAVDPTYTEMENCTDLIRTRTYPDFDESHQYGLWDKYRLLIYITMRAMFTGPYTGCIPSVQRPSLFTLTHSTDETKSSKNPAATSTMDDIASPASADSSRQLSRPFPSHSRALPKTQLHVWQLCTMLPQVATKTCRHTSGPPRAYTTAYATRLQRELQIKLAIVTAEYTQKYRQLYSVPND